MSKTLKTNNAWSEQGDNTNDIEMQGSGQVGDSMVNGYSEKNGEYENKRSEYIESPNNDKGGYEEKRRYDSGRDDRMRGRYDDRRRYDGRRDYDIRDDRMAPRYMGGRYDDRRRYDSSRGDYRGPRYGSYRGYNDGRYGSMPAEYGRGRNDYGGRLMNNDYGERRQWMRRRDGGYPPRRMTRQDDAPPNVTIAIFNLKRDMTKEEFDEVVDRTLKDQIKSQYVSKIIIDNHTGRCRGFGFITFEKLEDSVKAKELLEDVVILGNTIRVAFSIDDNRRDAPREDGDNKRKQHEAEEEGEVKKEQELNEKNDD